MISNFRKLLKISSVDITESGSHFFDEELDGEDYFVDTGNYDCDTRDIYEDNGSQAQDSVSQVYNLIHPGDRNTFLIITTLPCHCVLVQETMLDKKIVLDDIMISLWSMIITAKFGHHLQYYNPVLSPSN